MFGEIDFIVVNRDGRILAIEQKKGDLNEGRNLTKTYGDQEKDVRAQIERGVRSIRKKLEKKLKFHNFKLRGHDYNTLVGKILYCPDYHVLDPISAGFEENEIVDSWRREELASTIADTLRAGSGKNARFSKIVHNFFEQAFELVPDVRASIDRNRRSFMRLNGELVDLLDNIEMSPLRLRIKGVAGCGKTGIAIRFYERAAEVGKRPLMLCYNQSLCEYLISNVSGRGMVERWHGFCQRFLKDRGYTLDFGPAREHRGNQDEFWSNMENQVKLRTTEEEVPETWKFDSLIIDEAQDFEPGWIEILKPFLTDDHDFLWLEDPDQNIRGVQPPSATEFVGYSATRRNYRSPDTVVDFIHSVLPQFDFECRHPYPGDEVRVSTYDDAGDQLAKAEERIADLLGRNFSPADITLLTLRGINNSAMSELDDRLGKYTLRRFKGYDHHGRPRVSDGEILFESIGRFKGQESPAVILCDVDPDPNRLQDWEKRLYCGMTRATVRLELLVAAGRSNPLSRKLLKAARR